MLLQEAADRYLKAQYKFSDRQSIVRSETGFSPERWREFADLGWLGLVLPERFGGSGSSISDLVVLMQSFGRHLVVEPYVSTVCMGALALVNAGAEQHCARLLPDVIQGRLQLALAFAERPHGYRLNEIETTARKTGSSYEINGSKAVVLGAPNADFIIVAARTSGEWADPEGISLFLVSPRQQGMRLRNYSTIDARRAAEVSLSQVVVPGECLIGEAGSGLEPLRQTVAATTLALLGEALGAMDGALELTVDYLNMREQFGARLSSYQALRHRVADIVATSEETAAIVRRAVRIYDGQIPGDTRAELAAAKAYVGQFGMAACKECIQLHGGIAITEEYVVGHYLKRLTAIDRVFGGADHQLDIFLEEDALFRI